MLGNLKIRRALEFGGRKPDITHPGQRKGAELLAFEIEGEKIPLVFDAGQMVGLNLTLLVAGASQLFVFETHFHRPEHRPAQVFKEHEVGLRRSKIAEGERRIQVPPGESDAFPQAIADFVKSGMERLLKRGSLVLIEHFLGDE